MNKPNWQNQTIWTGDNLDIMRGMNSESVDLIYLDPPFNSNKNYAAPIGSEAAGAAFKDTWTLSDVDEAWHGEISDRDPALYGIIDAAGHAYGKSMKSYLIMMAVRLLEMKRLLRETGSLYLHCDPTASHYLKTLMDAIFGKDNFQNEIAWRYSWGIHISTRWNRKHDTIFFYSKGDSWTFNAKDVMEKREGEVLRRLATGVQGATMAADKSKTKDKTLKLPTDVWNIPTINAMAKERVGYPTQKPLALLERIVLASSNPGDVLLDPFCGCATACIASAKYERQWVGIDISSKALDLVKTRMRNELGLFGKCIHRTDIPQRTDLGIVLNYRTHKHTLFGKQEGVCKGCLHSFQFRNFTIDHIVPQAKGGTDHLGNLQLLCGACNSMKGSGSQEALIAKLKEEGIR